MRSPRLVRGLRALPLVALAWAAPHAQALGLGDARVVSQLNAPLVAEIQIVDATPAELAALRAEVPGREVFTRYGIDRPAFLAGASVSVRTAGAGAPVLVIRTEQPVADPFITVLLSAEWGRGRVLREFNLVVGRTAEIAEPLEPIEVQAPTVDAGRSGTVERAPDGATQPVSVPPASEPPAGKVIADSAAPSRPAAGSARGSGSVGVRRGDTLYGIADRVARDRGVSASQAMVGIYRANRDAFGASMNELRAGAVLRVPDIAELAALPPSLVSAEVNRAVSAWRNRGGSVARVADPGGRLRLVAPSVASVGIGGAAATKNARLASAGTADSASPAEGPSGAGNETAEQRLVRVESELAEKQRLLKLTSEQLSALQAKSAASPEASSGLVATLRALFGQAWWLWGVLLVAVLALLGLLVGVRRRAAAAEAELQAWSNAPRREFEQPAAPVVPVLAAADDLEGDPPTIQEAGSKVDLARAYVEMGDLAAARVELQSVLRIGNEAQRYEARRLLDSLT